MSDEALRVLDRRTLLAAIAGGALPGCLSGTPPAAGECEGLESDPDVPDDRVADLIVHNQRSEPVRVQLTVDGPERRRCDAFELEVEAYREYPAILEDGSRYVLGVTVDGERRAERSWERSTFGNVGTLALVTADGVEFEEFQH